VISIEPGDRIFNPVHDEWTITILAVYGRKAWTIHSDNTEPNEMWLSEIAARLTDSVWEKR